MVRSGLTLLVLLLGSGLVFCTLVDDFVVTTNNLQLTVVENSTFASGSVDINLRILKPTSNITLDWGSSLEPPYRENFTIVSRVGSSPAVTIDVGQVVQDSLQASVTLTTVPAAPDTTSFSKDDSVTLSIRFSTTVNREQKGLFSRQYSSTSGKWTMLATSLYPSSARDLFPCVDEPSMPVSFSMDLTIPVSWTVASPLELTASSTDETTKMTTYKYASRSPVPTYTLGMMVSNGLRSVNYPTQGKTNFTFWVPKDSTDVEYDFTFRFLSDCFSKVENFLNMKYTLSSALSIVLVPDLPTPIAARGIVFIRNTIIYSLDNWDLLYEKNLPVFNQFLRQFTEFSRVRSSWADSWLSSSMNTYLQYALLTSISSSLDFRSEFEVVARQSALALDGASSKPLEDHSVEGASPLVVEGSVTDPLKSLKGASLFSMLDLSFPAGSVYSTILALLQNNVNRAVTSVDFYSQFSATVNSGAYYVSDDTKRALDNLPYWFNSSGYQLINVTSEGSSSVTLQMVPFCGVLPCKASLINLTTPVSVGSKTEPRYFTPRQDIWVNTNTTTVASLMVGEDDWVAANMHSGGFFRTQYSSANWARFASPSSCVRSMKCSNLLDDAFALSAAGLLDYNVSLHFAVSNVGDRPYRDWYPVYNGLAALQDILWDTDIYPSYQNFLTPLLQRIHEQVEHGWFTNVYDGEKVYALFIEDFCKHDIGNIRSTALTTLPDILQGYALSVPSRYLDPLVCCGAELTTAVSAQSLWDTVKNTWASYDRRHFSSIALGCLSKNNLSVPQLKAFLVDDTELEPRSPYLATTLKFLAKKQPLELLTLISEYPEQLQNKLGSPVLVSLMSIAGRKINNKSQIDTLKRIASANVEAGVKDVASTLVETVSARISWLTLHNSSIVLALESNRLANSTSSAYIFPSSSSTVILLVPCLAAFLHRNS